MLRVTPELVRLYTSKNYGNLDYSVIVGLVAVIAAVMVVVMVSAGHRKFFLSPQSANPKPNFNFLNPQPQVRNNFSRFLNPQPQVCNFLNLEVRNRKSATFYEPSEKVLQSTTSRGELLRVDWQK